ncbi:MAG: class I SAM-dependent methyltransferase [Candidatus Marinimicrobia bacterium]|nr:class I SAM-dependent methyltransferase [Candidatus Neomarinimicrobiota bacterium]MDD5581952.1 class I SAM-dependent methyltransferase [Candidatus Neomarinimicrobiota bacterium]
MAEKHYYEQFKHTQEYLVPYFQKHIPDFKTFRILEVGCAEGGSLKVFHDLGMCVTGAELEPGRVAIGKNKNPELDIRVMDITDPKILDQLGTYDLIILRDVIEHVFDREAAFSNLQYLSSDHAYLYITFPPKYSAFAGHQQNCRSFLRRIPFLHILPSSMIRKMGKRQKEDPRVIEAIIGNYKNGLTIKRFERYYTKFHFKAVIKELFLIRPIYRIRFGLRPLRFPNIPFIREVCAMGCEYLLQKNDHA